jgi:hypothetical protein
MCLGTQFLVAELKVWLSRGGRLGDGALWPPESLQVWAFLHRSVPTNYYELLGVHPGASAEEIKRAFFTKSKEVLVPPR